MVGKDILRHHAVYWPIMLKAMGVKMPQTILAHGWWTMSGAKVSKSRGNAVDPIELCKTYGVDAFRYFLLREVTLGLDGAFSEDLLAERYTSDLANDLGNLWFRIVTMLQKYTEGKIPNGEFVHVDLEDLFSNVDYQMSNYDPRSALSSIWSQITEANVYIEDKKPWIMAKDPIQKKELASILRALTEKIAHISVLLLPFLPNTASQILKRLGLPIEWKIKQKEDFGKPFLKSGIVVERGEALFPRLDEEKIEK